MTHRNRRLTAQRNLNPSQLSAGGKGNSLGQLRLTVERLESRCLPSSGNQSPSIPIIYPADGGPPYRPDRILVRFASATEPKLVSGTSLYRLVPSVPGLYVIQVNAETNVETALAAYLQDPGVIYAERDYVVQADRIPNDPLFNQLWGLNNTGQTGGTPDADIDAPEAWDVSTGGISNSGRGPVIAVIDTGVDYTHPDLAANIWTNPNEIPNNGLDDDGNGYVDDVRGWDFVNNDNDPMDDNDHGTHVAGTIAAVGDNGIGVVGVNWKAQIMPLKFLDSLGFGSISDAVLAVDYSVRMGAVVSNNSWGGRANSQALLNAIDRARAAGQVFVAAAGNRASNNDSTPHYPSNYDLDNIIAVAATDDNDQLASFSNFGQRTVDLAAPGVNILSTLPGNTYGSFSGTSMATPHVAGVAALLRDFKPNMSYRAIIDAILRSVDVVPALAGRVSTGGRLNANKALAIIQPASVLQVSLPSPGIYTEGQDLIFGVKFSKRVFVSGSPSLRFDFNGQVGVSRIAVYNGGSGTDTLTFRYTVQPDDNAPNGITIVSPILLPARSAITDSFGFSAVLTFQDIDASGIVLDTPPRILAVAANRNGQNPWFKAGDTIIFAVTFTEPVIVTGNPELKLQVGPFNRSATYVSGSGTSTLLFGYVVQTGDEDRDGVTVLSPLDLSNGAQIKDTGGTPARLNFTPPDTSGILVDGVPPQITSLYAPLPGIYGQGQVLTFIARFNEPVLVVGQPSLSIVVGSSNRTASYVSGSGSNLLTFQYIVGPNEQDLDGITIKNTLQLQLPNDLVRDVAGNQTLIDFTPPDSSSVLVDSLPPSIVSISPVNTGTFRLGSAIDLLVRFSEPVILSNSANTAPYLSLRIGAFDRQATYVSGSGSNVWRFRYTVQAGDLDTDGIDVQSLNTNGTNLRDQAGNDANLTFSPINLGSVLVDGIIPTVVQVNLPAADIYRAGQVLSFAVFYDEPVAVSGGPNVPTLALRIGNSIRQANLTSAVLDRLIFQYTIHTGDDDLDGIEVLSPILLNGATIRDAAGNDANLNLPALDTSGIRIDAGGPTVVSVIGPPNGVYRVGQALDLRLIFSENAVVIGTPTISLTIGNRVVDAEYIQGSGTTTLVFRYVVAIGDSDTDGISYGNAVNLNGGSIRDAAGNPATLSFIPPDTANVKVDGVAPSIVSVQGPAPGYYGIGMAMFFQVQFSEPVIVSGANLPRLQIFAGPESRFASYWTGSGSANVTFRYVVQEGDPSGPVSIGSFLDLQGGQITDSVGNALTQTVFSPGSTGANLDGVRPQVLSVITPAPGTYSDGSILEFGLLMSEVIVADTSLGAPSLLVQIGNQIRSASFVGIGPANFVRFRYVVQPGDVDTDGIRLLGINLNNVRLLDVAGNAASINVSPQDLGQVLVDAQPPTLVRVIGPTARTYRLGESLQFTVEFSEPVNVSGGSPRLGLALGSQMGFADYVSGSGSTRLLFQYRVQPGDLASSVQVRSPLLLNGSSIQDGVGHNAELSFPSFFVPGVRIDAVAPKIQRVMPPSSGNYRTGQTLEFRVLFDEPVVVQTSGTIRPYLLLRIGSTSRRAVYSSGSGTNTLIFRYTIAASDRDTNGIQVNGTIYQPSGTRISDLAGNAAQVRFAPPSLVGLLVNAGLTSWLGPRR